MRLFFITLSLALAGLLQGQSLTPFQVTPQAQPSEEVRLAVHDQGLSGIDISYHTGTFSIKEEVAEGHTWQHVSLPGYGVTRQTGKPQLPVFHEMLMVPEGATFTWEYRYSGTCTHQDYRVYPALAPATDRYGDPEPSFTIDAVTYGTNAFYPAEPVSVAGIQEFRGMQVVWFDIVPIAFNPVTGELLVYEGISLSIKFQGATRFLDYPEHSVDFLRNFPLLSVNAGSISEEINAWLAGVSLQDNLPQLPASYIILTDSLFMDAAVKIADWKRQLGYTVEVVAGYNWTFTAMKNAVHSRYQQWTPKPDWLLIIGDDDRMPAEMVLNPANELFGTDLHLVTMSGPSDYVPEMAKGRISVNSASQALTVVDKIIQYEKNPPLDSAFYLKGLNCAQFQDEDFNNYADRRFVHSSEEILNYLTLKGYDIKRVYYADLTNSTPLYYNASYYSNGQSLPPALLSPSFNWNGNSGNITSYINSGVFYVLHRDHGYAGGTGWHAPYYVTSSINSLNNGNKTPVVFSINCHTGEFTLPECFAEKFHRHTNGGAVGVVAASYYSYSGWNDGFTAGMFDAIWSLPGLVPAFGSGGIFAPMLTPHGEIRNMGRVINQGLLRMTQTWSSSLPEARYTYRLYHYFGDPSMRIRTTFPAPITALHADSMACNSTLFAVSGVSCPNATATLTIPGRIIGSTTLVNGSGNIPVEPFSSQWLQLTISGPEHIPYIDTIWVIPDTLSVTYIKQDVQCMGSAEGEIHLDIQCGIPPFTVSWLHGPTSTSLSQLTAGTYHFTVTDGTNYTWSDSVVITEPQLLLQVNGTVTNVLCYYGANGSISLQVSGGVSPYQYTWSNGHHTSSVSGLAANTYFVSVTDAAGCQVTGSFPVIQPQPLQVGVDIIHDQTNNCTGSATALPTGGTPPFSYRWDDPDTQATQTAIGLCPGIQRVYVTDDHGCVTVKAFLLYNTSGIAEATAGEIRVFPNPLKGTELFVRLTGIPSFLHPLNVRIINAMGQNIYQKEILPVDNLLRIPDFPPSEGVHYLIIRSTEGDFYKAVKIIKL